MSKFTREKSFASEMDQMDPLKKFRDEFYIPKDRQGKDLIYFAGNSLGLQPKSVRSYVEQELKDWETLGVEGHLHAKNPWLPYHEFLTERTALITGAKPEEVVNMNSLTTNLHLLFASFYRPVKNKNKIVIESNAFPSDHYAVQSQIKFHGYDVVKSLVEIRPRDDEDFIRTDDILKYLDEHGDEVSLLWFAGVNYYSGQAFEMEKITKACHEKNVIAGFDLAHSVGNIDLHLHDWDVDFAVWCNYKYMNGGPGAIGGAFIHEKHLNNNALPKFLGWWGHDKKTRFLMEHEYIPIPTAESWQLSNPPILQLASLKASLDVFGKTSMPDLRKKSELLTGYLEFLINENQKGKVKIITPPDKNERGCQLSLRIAENGKKLYHSLID